MRLPRVRFKVQRPDPRGPRLVQTFDRIEDADALLERLRAERLRAVP